MRTLSAAITALAIVTCAAADVGQELLWPIDRPVMITGTFGEYRGAHFHHGIDISTGGRTGFAVYAADDGYISSVMYQQWGIGYAVMIRHGNGRQTLYGHLERFSDVILNNRRVMAFAVQIRNRKDFRIDFTRPDIMVRKGNVIGFSGESGIGREHFHFEVRSGDGEPVNPLTNGLHVPDKNGTVMTAVYLVPMDGFSQVDGSRQEKKFPVIASRKGECSLVSAVAPLVYGNIAVKISAYDRIGIMNRVAPYGFDMYADDKFLYGIRYDRIILGMSHRVGLVYDYDNSSLSAYTMYLCNRSSGEGILRAGSGGKTIQLKILCLDAGGNATTLRFRVRTAGTAPGPAGPAANLSPGRALELKSDEGGFSVRFPRGSALYDETIVLSIGGPPRSPAHGITVKSDAYSITPTNLCLDKPAEIMIPYANDDYRNVGVYRYSRDRRYYYFAGMDYDARVKSFRVQAWRMGTFFLARDNAPPRINFRNGLALRNGDRLRLYVGDAGSGIDFKTVSVRVDGRNAAWDYDPDRHCIEVLPHNPVLEKGKHEIAVSVSDNAGNGSGEQKFTYVVR